MVNRRAIKRLMGWICHQGIANVYEYLVIPHSLDNQVEEARKTVASKYHQRTGQILKR